MVRTAARNFAAALAERSQFKAIEQAYEAFSNDADARLALSVYQAKARLLRGILMLNAASALQILIFRHVRFATVAKWQTKILKITLGTSNPLVAAACGRKV